MDTNLWNAWKEVNKTSRAAWAEYKATSDITHAKWNEYFALSKKDRALFKKYLKLSNEATELLKQINRERKTKRSEELQDALKVLKTGSPACALSNYESSNHNMVKKALATIYGAERRYYCRSDWDVISCKSKMRFKNDYEEFCEWCDSKNSNVINSAIEYAENELETYK